MSEENKTIEVVEQNKLQEPYRPHRRRRNLMKFLRAIQYRALHPTLPNGLRKDLTEQQCLSIFLRSRQLIREGSYHPYLISKEEKAYQIEECYRQREKQIMEAQDEMAD